MADPGELAQQLSTVQSLKLAAMSITGLSKDALHVYFGMAVLIGAALVLRKSLRSIVPWLLVLLVALCGEIVDAGSQLTQSGKWEWPESARDIVNTLFWPTILLIAARFSPTFAAD